MRPIELIEAERGHFATPEPVHGQQDQHGAITDVPRVIRVRLGEEALHLGPRRACRKRLVVEETRTLDGRCKANGTLLVVFGIPEEGSQRLGGRRHGDATAVLPMEGQKPINVADGHGGEGTLLGTEPLTKPPRIPGVLPNGFAGKSPLVVQTRGKRLEQACTGHGVSCGLIEASQEAEPLGGYADETHLWPVPLLGLRLGGRLMCPPCSRKSDGRHINRAIVWERTSLSDDP